MGSFTKSWKNGNRNIWLLCHNFWINLDLLKHLKMTVWISVLWKISMQLVKKWLDMVTKWPFVICKFWETVSIFVIPSIFPPKRRIEFHERSKEVPIQRKSKNNLKNQTDGKQSLQNFQQFELLWTEWLWSGTWFLDVEVLFNK